MKNNLKEALVLVGIIGTGVLLVNPFDFWMPDMMLVSFLCLALILMAFFGSFILREHTEDERDVQHRALAGRNAFVVGASVLILGIVIQSFSHTTDPWLVGALLTMVVAKVVTRIWSDRNL